MITSKDSLSRLEYNFINRTGLRPIIGCELEFFLVTESTSELLDKNFVDFSKIYWSKDQDKFKISDQDINCFKCQLYNICKESDICLYPNSFQSEYGLNQYEISLSHDSNLHMLSTNIISTMNIIRDLSRDFNWRAIFRDKPFKDYDMGNGLHFHCSLYKGSYNLFSRRADINYPTILLQSIGGLLKNALNICSLLFTSDDNFKRFTPKINLSPTSRYVRNSITNAPTHICWGYNNRTSLVRIPDSYKNPDDQHIEFRLPGIESSSELVISILLCCILQGIEQELSPGDQIYGNAFDSQYNLSSLPSSLDDLSNRLDDTDCSTLSDLINELSS